MICEICKIETKTFATLGLHIYHYHPEVSKKHYYDTFINKVSSICYCGKEKKFRGLGEGYREYCSQMCCHNSDTIREQRSLKASGKKQTKETIDKRIKNTDQKKKEQTRQITMMEHYGSLTVFFEPELRSNRISKALKDKKHTKEHHEKVIESKRKNGTINHSEETKKNISVSVNKVYQSDDPPITTSQNNNKNHKQGYTHGYYYRSSYEQKFIEYCIENNIELESAETKEFRLQYEYDGKKKWYYPDFYLPQYDVVVEIKPIGLLTNDQIQCKIVSVGCHYPYSLITEEELEDLNEYFFSL